jgi:beta-phosphoglucomutase-like phosphatase (HAD superfamily)
VRDDDMIVRELHAVIFDLDCVLVDCQPASHEQEAMLAPGAFHLLEALRLCDVPMAVASSSRASWVERVLATVDIADRFDAVVSADTVDCRKPHPEPYSTAAQLLGVPAYRCLAVEDSRVGCLSATRAGAVVVHIDHTPSGDGDDGHAHLCVTDLGELEGHLHFAHRAISTRRSGRLVDAITPPV